MKKKSTHNYGSWEIDPERIKIPIAPHKGKYPEMIGMDTMYEGVITYLRLWNFWVRVGTPAERDTDYFFHDFESNATEVQNLLTVIGVTTAWPKTEEEIWNRISTVWDWLGANVRLDHDAYGDLVNAVGRWPSITEFSRYFREHGDLVWSACFSKAHLFALLLGRVLPRWHTSIVSAHHTEAGAPPTASHVYVGVYLTERWYYLDPTTVYAGPLPSFTDRHSVGTFSKVDYQHPFSACPVPLSSLDSVPYLPK